MRAAFEIGALVICEGRAPVKDTSIPASVTRHQASVLTLYRSRSLFFRCEWAGGRNPVNPTQHGFSSFRPCSHIGSLPLTTNDHVWIVDATTASQSIPCCCPVDVAVEELQVSQGHGVRRWRRGRARARHTTVPMEGGILAGLLRTDTKSTQSRSTYDSLLTDLEFAKGSTGFEFGSALLLWTETRLWMCAYTAS